jgi:short chain dehydrogenase
MTVRLVTRPHGDDCSHPCADGGPGSLIPVVSEWPASRRSPALVCWAEWDDRQVAVTQGRVALVTGSSRGLGAVIARRLARDGFAVAVNGRAGDEQVAAVGAAIREDGGAAEGFCADVTDERQVAALVAAITDRFGPVDVLVVNATGPQGEVRSDRAG